MIRSVQASAGLLMTQRMVVVVIASTMLCGCGQQSQTSQAPAQDAPSKSGAGSRRAGVGAATLSAGTKLVVRSTTALSTATNKMGETFAASLEEALEMGGRVVAPKGSSVEGKIVESDPGGRVEGRARIALQLTSLRLADGRSIAIETKSVAREAHGTKSKDAVKIGAASGVGAAIGAIAGGGKGAAIGAAAGAAAGTGAVLATRGDPAQIPSESVLHFELRSPVTVHF